MMNTRPRIGITMRIELETDRFYLSRHYSEAVEAAGGAPVHLSLIPKPDYVDSVLDGLDGILLPGSDSDVDPLRYGQQPHPALGAVHPIKDQTDLLVIEAAERKTTTTVRHLFRHAGTECISRRNSDSGHQVASTRSNQA